ncbi:DUF4007 family protein [Natronospirillum operosum]|uniref:DUF4007 family protein n=1 Tax=Natronospirillum operosum TaxID=2759953 RepID=A0A4Z0WBB3_9GAMM|nr:DUF4007 family protein [Natronospirillum operosum]TGG91796.1 DUF4007 family protein [Natronospirillum operosum]
MARGLLYQPGYRPQFSGHETFPLRYGWLKKCFDRVSQTEHETENKSLCWGDDAIASFGVGKNMVASMRHWATVAGIIEEPSGTNQVKTTPVGQLLFGHDGVDPFLENPNSLWLIHWKLATEWKKKTTWYWAFSHYSAVTFERDKFIHRLKRDWPAAAETTIKNDVGCFIRTYTAQSSGAKAGQDDSLESPLTELGLIKRVSRRDEYRFVRGQKTTLGDGTFVYALLEFWQQFSPTSSTLSFEAIAHEPGSPGRVFLLDENDVADRLLKIEQATAHSLRWSETAGLKQVIRHPDFDFDGAIDFIRKDYESSDESEAA